MRFGLLPFWDNDVCSDLDQTSLCCTPTGTPVQLSPQSRVPWRHHCMSVREQKRDIEKKKGKWVCMFEDEWHIWLLVFCYTVEVRQVHPVSSSSWLWVAASKLWLMMARVRGIRIKAPLMLPRTVAKEGGADGGACDHVRGIKFDFCFVFSPRASSETSAQIVLTVIFLIYYNCIFSKWEIKVLSVCLLVRLNRALSLNIALLYFFKSKPADQLMTPWYDWRNSERGEHSAMYVSASINV